MANCEGQIAMRFSPAPGKIKVMRTRTANKLRYSLLVALTFSDLYVRVPRASPRVQRPELASNTTMVHVADGALSFIQGKTQSKLKTSAKPPRQQCLRGVKKGLLSGGVFRRYPAWSSASKMVSILENNSKIQKFVKSDYRFLQLPYIKDVGSAPAYSILVYGGAAHGHIEIKVPAAHLLKKGFTYAMKSNDGKEVKISLAELNYVYISDYIDAFPRNHSSSRISNNKPDNQRPLVAVYELVKI